MILGLMRAAVGLKGFGVSLLLVFLRSIDAPFTFLATKNNNFVFCSISAFAIPGCGEVGRFPSLYLTLKLRNYICFLSCLWKEK